MLFNTLEFAIFLPIVFLLYWVIGSARNFGQNILLLFASYYFYGSWDWRFLFLIAFSTLADFFIAKRIEQTTHQGLRKRYLILSLIVNLGVLGFFKYYNFFVESFVDFFLIFGVKPNLTTLNIILPVGISFYTFQTLSYTIDVYRRKLNATQNFVQFASFVSFFPQLVAGPIERATNLLGQFEKQRTFDYNQARKGMQQILWGLFMKVFIADQLAPFVEDAFGNIESATVIELFVGLLAFSFQIYGDFAGYSNIAIGVAALFGFSLMKNFNYPYFAVNIIDFWRRWHISLSTWFRDYLYIPLGGSRTTIPLQIRNIFVIFLVSGFWHGANWTFVVWGGYHALLFIPFMFFKAKKPAPDQTKIIITGTKQLLSILINFVLVGVGWVFFRANSLSDALLFLKRIATDFTDLFYASLPLQPLGIISLFVLVEWLGRNKDFPIDFAQNNKYSVVRWSVYLTIIILILYALDSTSANSFIYFQF